MTGLTFHKAAIKKLLRYSSSNPSLRRWDLIMQLRASIIAMVSNRSAINYLPRFRLFTWKFNRALTYSSLLCRPNFSFLFSTRPLPGENDPHSSVTIGESSRTSFLSIAIPLDQGNAWGSCFLFAVAWSVRISSSDFSARLTSGDQLGVGGPGCFLCLEKVPWDKTNCFRLRLQVAGYWLPLPVASAVSGYRFADKVNRCSWDM